MDVTQIQTAAMGSSAFDEGPLSSIADRAQQAFAKEYLSLGSERQMIFAAGNDASVANDPAALVALQVAMAEHEKRVNLVSALTHHVVEGVETLLKS